MVGAVCSVEQVRRITLSLSASINVYPHQIRTSLPTYHTSTALSLYSKPNSEEFANLPYYYAYLPYFILDSFQPLF